MPNLIQYVYAGLRLSSKNKKQYAYVVLGTNSEDFYAKKLVGLEMIGTIVECEKTETGVKAPYKIKGKVEGKDAKHVGKWTAQQQANLNILKGLTEAKKEHSDSVREHIKWFKDCTHGMTRQQKENFALWVYNELKK